MGSSGVRKTVYILAAVIAVVFGLTFNKYVSKPLMTKEQLSQTGTVVFETPRAIEFKGLRDHNGNEFNPESLKDGWTLVYFGYTLLTF